MTTFRWTVLRGAVLLGVVLWLGAFALAVTATTMPEMSISIGAAVLALGCFLGPIAWNATHRSVANELAENEQEQRERRAMERRR